MYDSMQVVFKMTVAVAIYFADIMGKRADVSSRRRFAQYEYEKNKLMFYLFFYKHRIRNIV